VNAAKTGGMEVKKINFQVPYGTDFQTVLNYPGIFRIDAQCQNFGDRLDVSATSGVDHSVISEIAIQSENDANDTDVAQDLWSSSVNNFNAGVSVPIDVPRQSTATIHFATPDGFVSTTEIQMHRPQANGHDCVLTGFSIGG
jgi:hypothetical protein